MGFETSAIYKHLETTDATSTAQMLKREIVYANDIDALKYKTEAGVFKYFYPSTSGGSAGIVDDTYIPVSDGSIYVNSNITKSSDGTIDILKSTSGGNNLVISNSNNGIYLSAGDGPELVLKNDIISYTSSVPDAPALSAVGKIKMVPIYVYSNLIGEYSTNNKMELHTLAYHYKNNPGGTYTITPYSKKAAEFFTLDTLAYSATSGNYFSFSTNENGNFLQSLGVDLIIATQDKALFNSDTDTEFAYFNDGGVVCRDSLAVGYGWWERPTPYGNFILKNSISATVNNDTNILKNLIVSESVNAKSLNVNNKTLAIDSNIILQNTQSANKCDINLSASNNKMELFSYGTGTTGTTYGVNNSNKLSVISASNLGIGVSGLTIEANNAFIKTNNFNVSGTTADITTNIISTGNIYVSASTTNAKTFQNVVKLGTNSHTSTVYGSSYGGTTSAGVSNNVVITNARSRIDDDYRRMIRADEQINLVCDNTTASVNQVSMYTNHIRIGDSAIVSISTGGYTCYCIRAYVSGTQSEGTILKWSNAADATMVPVTAGDDMPVGIMVMADDGTNNYFVTNNYAWVAVQGYARVKNGSAVNGTRGDVAYVHATEGGVANFASSIPASTDHWREIGHVVSTGSGSGGYTLCTLHFN